MQSWGCLGWECITNDVGTPSVPLLQGGGIMNSTSLWFLGEPCLFVEGNSLDEHPKGWASPRFMRWLERSMAATALQVHPKLREAWLRAVTLRDRRSGDEAFEKDKKQTLESLRAAHVAAKVEALRANDELSYRRRLNLFSAGTAGEKAYEEAAKQAFESKQKAKRLAERVQELEKLGDEGAQIRKDFESSASNATPLLIDGKPVHLNGVYRVTSHIGKPCSCGETPCADAHLEVAKNILAAAKPDIGPKEHVRVVRAVVFEGTYEAVQKQIAASQPVGSGNINGSAGCKITIAQGEIERVLPPSIPVEGY
jgi:hypothetical protein